MKKELCIDKELSFTAIVDASTQVTPSAENLLQLVLSKASAELHIVTITLVWKSFFATLKKENFYQIPTYRMKREEVKTIIFRYIFGYYNTQRVNSFNEGDIPPATLRTSEQLSHHTA